MKGYLLFDNEETKENFSTLTWGHVKNNGHEIDIPDDATILHCWPGDVRSSEILHFPIPRPKVKKWLWKCGELWYTKEHLSAEEIKKRSNMPCLSKVEGSEIEVES